MHTELISIPTPTMALEGAFHRPASGPAKGAAMLCHGNTMNFYVGAPRFLPPALTAMGLSCLAFNRRGHDILSIRDCRVPEGTAFQLVREGWEDNRLAAGWLDKQGFANPIVIGHSYGGYLGIQHVADHPQTPALVLLSASVGGARMDQVVRNMLGDRLDELTEKAEELCAMGRGRDVMLVPGWWVAVSAESFLDRIAGMPDMMALAPRIKCPVLCLIGDQESGNHYAAEEFKALAGGPCEVAVVPDCEHFYKGRETAVTEIVAGFLKRTLALG